MSQLYDLFRKFTYVRDSVKEIGSKLITNRAITDSILPKILKNPVDFATGTGHEIHSLKNGRGSDDGISYICGCLSYISNAGGLYLCFLIDQETLTYLFEMDIEDIRKRYGLITVQCVYKGVDCYACVASVITPQKTYTVTEAASVLACLTNEYASGF